MTHSLFAGQIWGAEALTGGANAACVGASILITASGAGTVVILLGDGSSVTVTVPTGDTLLPFQAQKYTAGTATVTRAYNLFQ